MLAVSLPPLNTRNTEEDRPVIIPVGTDLVAVQLEDAMTQQRLGQKEQARSTLARLRELNSKPPWSTNAETAAFLREAAALIEDRPAERSP